jgi:hypothetical protein
MDDDNRLGLLNGKSVRIVLETKEGRMFLERCRDDQVALIGHVYALDDEIRELRRKVDKLELENLELIARLQGLGENRQRISRSEAAAPEFRSVCPCERRICR